MPGAAHREPKKRTKTRRKTRAGKNVILHDDNCRYRMLFERMAEGFSLHEIVTDSEGRPIDYVFVEVNPAFEILTGLKRETVIGRRVTEVLPGIEPYWIERFGQVALTGSPSRFENYAAPLGRWYEVFAYSPAPRQFAVVFLDVTNRRETESALRESQADLNRAQAVAHTGSWRLDVLRNELSWSDETCRMFGMAKGTPLTYETFLNSVHPDDRERVDQNWSAALRGENPYDIEHRIVVDGAVKWVRERAELEFDTQGALLGGFGTVQDVTERKQAEEALREAKENLEARVSERTAELELANVTLEREMAERRRAEGAVLAERQLFYDVLETLPVYVVLLTPDYRVSFANRVFRERFGVSEKRCYEHLFGRLEPCEICETYGVLQTMAPHEWEWVGPDARTYQVFDFPFVDTTGAVLILEMGIDITERKHSEEEVRRYQEHLEDVVRQRTAEVEKRNAQLAAEIAERERTEEALRQNEAVLMRSNQDLEQFAYVASHDLQEPLRQIGGFVQLLRRDYAPLFDATAGEYFDFVTDAALRMQSLIQGLLDYSRVGRSSAVTSKVSLDQAARTAMVNLAARISETGAKISLGELPSVPGNSTLLTQVFQNLIGNSLKFRSERPLDIQIGSRIDGNEWQVWVKDNGIGFQQEYAGRIFQVFQRLHGRGAYPGTGIGLAICKRAVEEHGGRIWADSSPGAGTTFYFTLPAG